MYLGKDPLWFNSRKRPVNLRILGGRFTGGLTVLHEGGQPGSTMFKAQINWTQFAWALCYPLSFCPLGTPSWRHKRDYRDKLKPGYLGSRYHNTGIPANWDGSVVKLNLLHLTKMLRSRQSKPARLIQSTPTDPFGFRSYHEQGHKHSRKNRENREHQKHFWNQLLCCKKEANQTWET